MKLNLRTILLFICALTTGSPVFANGIDFSDSQGYFGVPHDNVGIGSSAPGQKLDVTGTIRTVGFTVSGQSPISGYVLTASDSAGDTTWSSAGGVSGWTVTGNNVYETFNGNVGIGTNLLTTAALTVMNGNVGIGTWIPAGAMIVMGGNVGINSISPSATLSVNGGTASSGVSVPQALFIQGANGNGNGANGGGVALNTGNGGGGGPGSAGSAGPFSILTGNGGAATNAGAGGTITLTAGNGNGGTSIGGAGGAITLTAGNGGGGPTPGSGGSLTLNPGAGNSASFNGNIILANLQGNVGIGTTSPGSILSVLGGASIGSYATTAAPSGGMIISGNVGIGSLAPGKTLDVTGTTRTVGFTMSGQAPISGYVLTASDSDGDTTWSSAGGVSGWTVTGSNVYETFNGNVGIGTNQLTTAALTVMNGNVGIGTWVPGGSLVVLGGNVGIGTSSPSSLLSVNGNSTLGAEFSSRDFIISSGAGSLAGGSTNSVATLQPATITSSNSGSLAFGVTTSSIVGSSSITASGAGSIALGEATPGQVLQATGLGSVAIGQNVQALNNNSFALGIGVINNISATFMVGFSPSPTLTVTSTNVGIGTFNPFGGGLIVTNGNVGIGSLVPGKLLDVQGTVRALGFTMSGQSPIAGYVLTASDSAGDTTWSSAGGVSGWTVTGSNVYETFNGNVGIGTTLLTTAALTVMNGNVGIGTWIPQGSLIVLGGNVGIGTSSPSASLAVNGSSILGYVQNNLDSIVSNGIGSLAGGYASHTISDSGIITSSGQGSFAFGYSNGDLGVGNGVITANGNGAIALGAAGANQTLQATGSASVAIGSAVQATANNAFALGANVVNPIASTFMVGFNPAPTLTVTGTNVGIGTYNPSQTFVVGIGTTLIGTDIIVNGADKKMQVYTNTTAQGLEVRNETSNGAAFSSGTAVNGTVTGANVTNQALYGWATGAGTNYGLLVAQGWGYFNSNVGIGSMYPGQSLDVAGTVRTTGFTMSGQAPIAGYVLTSSDSSGDATWSALGGVAGVSGWTVTVNNVYETNGGNVGIGTNLVTTSALTVMNGNVGIGTWIPAASFNVNGNSIFGSLGSTTDSITSSGTGSLAGGNAVHSTGNSGVISATSQGSLAFGYATGISGQNGTITSINQGSIALGYAFASPLEATFEGSIALGAAAGGSLESTGQGSIAMGDSSAGGVILANCPGCIAAGYANSGETLEVLGAGAVALGENVEALAGNALVLGQNVINRTPTTLMIGFNPTPTLTVTGTNVGIGTFNPFGGGLIVTNGNVGIGTLAPSALLTVNGNSVIGSVGSSTDSITSNGTGSFAGGGASHNISNLGAITSSGVGSFAFGQALGNGAGNGIITASGNGAIAFGAGISGGTLAATANESVAIGTNVQATGAFAIALGESVVNSMNASLMVGFNADTLPTLTVTATNVGIGTFNPFGGGLIVTNGNVGIGSLTPGKTLDVTGTVRTTNFTMSGQVPIAGYVMTASDSAGDTTWSSPGGVSGWTVTGNNVYETDNGNVGIGTTKLTTAALAVMNGNVGIGTWIPNGSLIVQGGNVGIGTSSPSATFTVNGSSILGYVNSSTDSITANSSGSLAGGNAVDGGGHSGAISATNQGSLAFGTAAGSLVGNATLASTNLGSIAMGYASAGTLEALGSGSIALGYSTGTLQANGTGSVAIGQNVQANANNAFAVGSSVVNPTASTFMVGFNAAPTLTVTGTNVGIGTFNPFGGGLIVTNGNVGIGSLAPGQLLDVQGTLRVLGGGSVGIGTSLVSTSALTVMSGNVGIGTWVPGDIFQVGNYKSSTSGFMVDSNGNVGIGTTTTSNAALSIISGNVGIGTAKPPYQLYVTNTGFVNTLTTNKSTFMEVSYGNGSGAQANFTLAASFNKINFHALSNYTLTDNGGNYSATNDWYVVPVSGIYLVHTKLRITDSATQFVSYGQGSGTVAADSPTFLWQQTVTTTAQRNGSENVSMRHYTAGNDVFMFTYAGGAMTSSDGDFSIYLLTAD